MATDTPDGVPHIDVDQVRRLDLWCDQLRAMFGAPPYLVGSSLYRRDWRDVDIRILVSDKRAKQLRRIMRLLDLNMLLSQWGRQQTGLPIDCQIQSRSEWDQHDGKLVNPRFTTPHPPELDKGHSHG